MKSAGVSHPMDELGAIEEEDLLGLGGNADSMIISSDNKKNDTFADRAGSQSLLANKTMHET
jgi:hypothetical protein